MRGGSRRLALVAAAAAAVRCAVSFTPPARRLGANMPGWASRPNSGGELRGEGGEVNGSLQHTKSKSLPSSTKAAKKTRRGGKGGARGESKSMSNTSAEILETTIESTATFFDDELCLLDDSGIEQCFVSYPSDESNGVSFDRSLPFTTKGHNDNVDVLLRVIPIVMPILAFSTYVPTANIFHEFVDWLSDNTWVQVDGGQYQAQIITPAVNGLVVPSMALLFATLTSNTINTLRLRQMQIRTSLNTEANDLRMLVTMVDSMPKTQDGTAALKNHLRQYLVQYSSRIIAESNPGLSTGIDRLKSMDNELNGFLTILNSLSQASYATQYIDTYLPASNYTIDQSVFNNYDRQLGLDARQRQILIPFVSPNLLSETYGALNRLRTERSTRLAVLQSTYPVLHYVILLLLSASICLAFLMETNIDLLIFLSAIQLRILWSMLIGTFSALAVVNYDLVDPFMGSYNVVSSVDQFYNIRDSILATMKLEDRDS